MRCYPVSSAVNSGEGALFAGGVARRLRQAAAVALLAIFAGGCAVSNRIALPLLPQVDVLVLLQASLGPGGAGQAYPAQTISTNLTITSTAVLSACGFVSPPGTAPGNNVVPRGLQITVGTPPGGATNTGCTISGMIDPAVTPGTYVFTVRAADNNAPPQTDDETYSIVISSLAFTLGANPVATVTGETFSVTWSFTVVGSPANPNQSVLVELVNAANVVEDSCTAGVGAGGCGGLTSPAVGNKTIRLTYPAPGQVDANFPAGGGTSRAHTVTAASTTTTITADAPDPSVSGQQYTVNVTVAPVAPGAGAPTGNVSVSDGLGNNCVVALTAGANQSTGSCMLNGPTAGARTLTASYAGDANYSASMGTNPHTVNPAPTTTTITSDVADPSVVGQAYTINVTVDVNAPGAGTPTGVVAINDGQGVACNAALAAGPGANQASGSCSLTSVTTTASLLTASYPGDANFAASLDTEAHVVSTAGTTTAITSDLPDPSASGESYLVNFTVAAVAPGMGEPTGNVTADDGAGQSCVGALTPGAPGSNTSTGSCSLQSASASGPGPAKTVTATYGGDANFSGSIGTTGHTVNPANTATVVVSSSALVGGIRTSEFQEAVTFTATVTILAPGSATPIGLTGVVDFVDITTATNLCTGVAVTAGMANCVVSNLAVGIHSVQARYDAANTDLNFNSSTGTERQQVVPAATQTAVLSSSNPSEFQETVTFTATITVPGPGSGSPIAPSGTVTFFDGAVAIAACGSQPVATSQATCVTAALSVGGHNVTATYNGDGNFALSTSAVLPQTVNPAATATAVTSAPDPSDFQQAVTLTATVTVPGPGSASPIAPAGAVQFFDGGVGIAGCAAQPLVAGQATCVTSTLAVGARSISANYGGDGNFAASTSPVHLHTVNQAGTTTTITNAAALMTNPTVVGEPYAVNVTVSVNPPGGGIPTGAVTVNDGTGGVCTIAALVAGTGSCLLTSTSVGAPKTLTATYGGDANYTGSTSAGVSHVVNQATTATTIIASPVVPTVVGEAYTVGFLVTVNAPGAGTPTGVVTVSDGSQTCVATLPTASCLLTSTTAGLKTLTASYAGDANFAASASGGVLHTVNPANTTTTITADAPDPSGPAANYTVSVVVDVSAPGSGSPTGSVLVSDNNVPLVTCLAPLAPGPGANQSSGSCILASNPVVTPTTLNLTANYVGDGNFNASLSAVEPHTVDVVMITPITLGAGTEGRMIGTGPSGLVGVRFPITGGLAPYTCSDGGTLPAGITVVTAVTGTDCELQGTPAAGAAAAGPYAVDITVTDASAASDTTGVIAWDINPPLIVAVGGNPATLADAVEDRNYSFSFTTVGIGGNGPYTWSESGGPNLGPGGSAGCAGFAALASNGALTGTAPLVSGGGTCNFTVQVTDTATTTTAAGSDTQATTIIVQPELTVVTMNLANALRGSVYLPTGQPGEVIQSAGGLALSSAPAVVTYTEMSGNFTGPIGGVWTGTGPCAGLMFNETASSVVSVFNLDTVVSGTATTAGTCNFTVVVNDAGNGPTGPDPTPPLQGFTILIFDTLAYVANGAGNTLEIINTDTNVFVSSITLAAPSNQVAISPDGQGVFVSLTAAEQIVAVDASTNTVFGTFDVSLNCDQPEGLAITDLGAGVLRVFVACSGTDAATGERIATFDFDPSGGAPGTFTFVTAADVDQGGGTDAPRRLAVTPDGSTVFAGVHRGAGNNGRWARVSAATGVLVSSTDFGAGSATDCNEPVGVAIAQTAFAGNPVEAYFACEGQDAVAVVDVATNTHLDVTGSGANRNIVLAGTGANTIVFNPAGTRAYVTMSVSDEVEVIDTAARTATNVNLPITGPLTADVNPIGVTIPNVTSVEVFIALSGTVATAAPGVAILNDAATPTVGTNNTINPASTPAYPAGSAPQGIAHTPIPR